MTKSMVVFKFCMVSILLSCSFIGKAQFCSLNGIVSFDDCGDSGIFILHKLDGLVDPTNEVLYEVVLPTDTDVNPYDGQAIEFGIASTFAATCSEADQGAVLSCFDYQVPPQVDWHYACPSLQEFVVPPCDGTSIDAYVLNGEQYFYVHGNGSSDLYNDCTVVCSGNDCLTQFGIGTPATAQFECGDSVPIYLETSACIGETILVSATYPPGIFSADCDVSLTIAPETNVLVQIATGVYEVLVTEDITYSLQWVADPDATCAAAVTETVRTVVITAEVCEECENPLDCDDGECANGQEYWDEFSCTCESEFLPDCDHPMALNYDPNATCPLLQYCDFPPIESPLCLGDSVLIGMFTISDFILCEDGYTFGLDSSDPDDNSLNYVGYLTPWGAPQHMVGWWVKPGVGETTYTYWDTNTSDCQPIETSFTIQVDDCDMTSGIDEPLDNSLLLNYQAGILNVFTTSDYQDVNYRIYSINGQLYEQGMSSAAQWAVDVSNLASGLYLFESTIGSELFFVR